MKNWVVLSVITVHPFLSSLYIKLCERLGGDGFFIKLGIVKACCYSASFSLRLYISNFVKDWAVLDFFIKLGIVKACCTAAD